jgi:hypothetical protein
MSDITMIAKQFFDACETGGGWNTCQAFCTADASFAAQSEPLADITTLAAYTDWMKGLLSFMPDGTYQVKSFATDEAERNVAAYAVFRPLPTDRQAHDDRLCLRHAVQRRPDFPHDQDLECAMGHEGTRLDVAIRACSASSH